jgi:quinol monooxygenase YgiN
LFRGSTGYAGSGPHLWRQIGLCVLPGSKLLSRNQDLIMLKVIAQDYIRVECVDAVMPLYRELVEKTRREERCISYDLFIDQKDPGHFVFIEEWPDRAALDEHCRSEHFVRLVPLIDSHQREKGTYILMDPVAL